MNLRDTIYNIAAKAVVAVGASPELKKIIKAKTSVDKKNK